MDIRDMLEDLGETIWLGVRSAVFALCLTIVVLLSLEGIFYFIPSNSPSATKESSQISFSRSGSFVVDCKERDTSPVKSSIKGLTCQVKYNLKWK